MRDNPSPAPEAPPPGGLLSGPAAYRADTPWPPGVALLTTGGIVAAGVAAMGLVVLAIGLAAGAAPTTPAVEIRGRLWGLAAMQTVTVALTLWASRGYGGRIREVLALRGAPTGWRAYVGAILAIIAFHALLTAVQYFFLRHDLLTDVRPIVRVVAGDHFPLAAVVMTAGAALSEELLFRGFLLGALAQTRLGFAGAALVSSAAWTTLHVGYSLVGLLDVFANGLLFSWLLWRTGSLPLLIFCHAFYNGSVLIALLAAVRWQAELGLDGI